MDWTSILGAALMAGVALFVWYGVAWMALAHHHRDYVPCPDPDVIERAIDTLPPRDAWYVRPHMAEYPGGMKDPALAERMKSRPGAVVLVLPPGPPMRGGTFVRSYVLNVLEAFGLALLVTWATGGAPAGLLDCVGLCLGAALFVGVASPLSLANWRASPLRFALTSILDKAVGYALVGVVLHFVL